MVKVMRMSYVLHRERQQALWGCPKRVTLSIALISQALSSVAALLVCLSVASAPI